MELEKEQIEALKSSHRRAKDRRSADRIKAVLLLGKGYSCEQVGEILLMDDDTVRNYGKAYLNGGIDSLISDTRGGKPPKLDKSQEALLEAHLSKKIYPSTAGIIKWVLENFNVRYSRTGMTCLLIRMGYTYKKPKKMSLVGDVQKQHGFVEKYREPEKNLDPEGTILFMDGVHPQHNSVAAYGWFKKGKAIQLPTNTGRKRININGALDLKRRKAHIIEYEMINAQTVIDHLKKLLEIYQKGTIYIVLDNARYYRAKVVKEFLEENSRIQLVFLPPYCPNLNIIERLWPVMKKQVVYNKYYEKFKDFHKAIFDFFENKDWNKPCYDKFLADNFHILEPQFFSGFKMA